MIRNFQKTESTKKLLKDVKQMSWHSTRSSFSTAGSATHHSGSDSAASSSRQQQHAITTTNTSHKRTLSKYDKVKLSIELSVPPSPHNTAFMVETVVRRRGNTTYTMDLQLPGKCFPLFVAEQHGQTFVMKSDPSNHRNSTETVMGTVCKKPSNEQKKKSSGSSTVLTDTKKQPRRCRAHIHGRSSSETKEPFSKEGGQRSLDFYGRGREASRKNMQLVDGSGKLTLQMVKWGKDEFHVDFNYPFDAFHAFGFCLAQFDMS
ncbi:MAG: hypothetical protein SGARI_002584 [Bacillariaceae sp.]